MSWAGRGRQRVRQIALARCHRCAGDRGVSSLELVVLTPLIILMTFLPVQVALVLQARQVATAAAQEGARAARVVDLDAGQAQTAGAQRATEFARTLGGNTFRNSSVQVVRGPEQVTVNVTGQALGILPGIELNVTGQSVTPVERFTGP